MAGIVGIGVVALPPVKSSLSNPGILFPYGKNQSGWFSGISFFFQDVNILDHLTVYHGLMVYSLSIPSCSYFL